MASEYDALLDQPAQQKSEYDSLLAEPPKEQSSVLGEIGTAIKNTAVGFVKGLARPPTLAEIALPIFGGQIERQYQHTKEAEQRIQGGESVVPSVGRAFAPNVSELADPEASRQEKIQAGVNIAAEVAPFLIPALRGVAKYGVAGRSLSDIAFGAKPKSEPIVTETAAAQEIKGGELNAEQISQAARSNGDVQLPIGQAAREINGGQVPAAIGGERVPPRGQGETLQQPAQETLAELAQRKAGRNIVARSEMVTRRQQVDNLIDKLKQNVRGLRFQGDEAGAVKVEGQIEDLKARRGKIISGEDTFQGGQGTEAQPAQETVAPVPSEVSPTAETPTTVGETTATRQAGDTGARPVALLHPDEIKSIQQFTKDKSDAVNSPLRAGLEPNTVAKGVIDNLDSALTKLPKYEGDKYRYIGFDDKWGGEKLFNDTLSNFQEGKEVTFPEFQSSSKDKFPYTTVPKGNHAIFAKIKGEIGADVSKWGYGSEGEILIPRNSKFVVESVKRSGNSAEVTLRADTGSKPVSPVPKAEGATTAQPLTQTEKGGVNEKEVQASNEAQNEGQKLQVTPEPASVQPPAAPPETPQQLGEALKEEPRLAGPSNRVLQERAAKGEIPQAPESGVGILKEDLVARSRAEYSPERAQLSAEKIATGESTLMDEGVAVIHEEALTKAAAAAERALDVNPTDPALQQAHQIAVAEMSKWQRDVIQPMKTNWSNKGINLQGATDVDTGTLVGLQRLAWDTAKRDFRPDEVPVFKEAAQRVTRGLSEEKASIAKANEAVQKVLKPSRYMDLNQLRESLADTLKTITC